MQPKSLRTIGQRQGAPEAGAAASPLVNSAGQPLQAGAPQAPDATADPGVEGSAEAARALVDLCQTAGAMGRINNAALANLMSVNQKGMQALLAATTLPELMAAQMSWVTAATNATFDFWQRLGGMAWTTEASYLPEAMGSLDKAVSAVPASAASQAATAGQAVASADPFNLWMRPFNAAWGALTSPPNLH